MTIHGACLSHPLRGDVRGTVATTAQRDAIVAESILAILETRKGERVMVPDYGIADFVFSVVDSGFAARLAYELQTQIKRYEPLVDRVKVNAGALIDGKFIGGVNQDASRAAVSVSFTVRGSNTVRNLVFPTWELRG
jgi:phage baseplate assembly protein W